MERGRSKERKRKKGSSTCSAAQPALLTALLANASATQRQHISSPPPPSESASTRFGSPFHGGDGRLFPSFPIPRPFVLCKSKGGLPFNSPIKEKLLRGKRNEESRSTNSCSKLNAPSANQHSFEYYCYYMFSVGNNYCKV